MTTIGPTNGDAWRTVGAILQRNADWYPDVTAVVFGEKRISYRNYLERCYRLANALFTLGVRKGDRVSILSRNRLEYCEYYGACELAGYIAAPLNFRLAAPEIAVMLARLDPGVLIYEAALATLAADALASHSKPIQRIVFGQASITQFLDYEKIIADAPAQPTWSRPEPNDIVYLMSTSGTTGLPKAVIRSHRATVYLAETLAADYFLPLGAVTLVVTPMFHVGGKDLRAAALWRAGTVIVLQGFDVEEVVHAIVRDRVNAMFLVAAQLQALLDVPDLEKYDLSSLRRVSLAGGPCPAPLLARGIAVLGPVFCVQYGMTEGMVAIMHPSEFGPGGDDKLRRIAAVGHSVPQGEIRIARPDGGEAAIDEAGEIWTRSDMMFEGYWQDQAATQAAMQDGFFRTGDIGFRDKDGYIFLIDRLKDMIVSGGENIYSREVEIALIAHPSVLDAAVIGVTHPRWGETAVAYVTASPGSDLDEATLIEHCRSLIARYKCPTRIVFTPSFPLTPSGKVNKVALRERYRSEEQQS